MLKEQPLKMTPPLLGFSDITDYTLRPVAGNPCFFTLEAADGPSFILSKPSFFFPNYVVQVKRNALANIEVEEKEPEVYVIVTVPEKTADMTANLLAPLFVNREKALACQIVLVDTDYSTKHYLFPPETRRNCG